LEVKRDGKLIVEDYCNCLGEKWMAARIERKN
jgi:hypothetical protein